MLVDDIRKAISPKKTRSQAWLDLMDDAHSIGLKTTATMVYGFGETGAQRVEHLMKVRSCKIRPEASPPSSLEFFTQQNQVDCLG